MTVGMERPNPGATDEALGELRRFATAPLPDGYVAFLERNDGGRPEGNAFDYGKDEGSTVTRFLAAREVVATARTLDGRFSPGSLPVAEDVCGNYVLLRPDAAGAWRVRFWDHEVEEREVEVAPSFEAFLEALHPFSPDDVELDPKRVISAWIDPEFLKALKRERE